MTTMVEKVARAIGLSLDESNTPWEKCGAGFKEICTDAARAAIEAMMEPTEAMIMSQGKSKPENAATETQRERAEALNRSVRRLAVETWREMIQAALEEKQ